MSTRAFGSDAVQVARLRLLGAGRIVRDEGDVVHYRVSRKWQIVCVTGDNEYDVWEVTPQWPGVTLHKTDLTLEQAREFVRQHGYGSEGYER